MIKKWSYNWLKFTIQQEEFLRETKKYLWRFNEHWKCEEREKKEGRYFDTHEECSDYHVQRLNRQVESYERRILELRRLINETQAEIGVLLANRQIEGV